jgi:hypothetical protein
MRTPYSEGYLLDAPKSEVANKTASPMNTPPAPADAAIAPAAAGTTNCPNLFPKSLAETASARSFATVFCETKDIVNGWPTPSENPAIKTITPNESGVFANAIAAQAMTETEVLTINN